MTDIVSILSSALILGSVYALVTIGMTLIYGILRVLDMSQGAMVMVGGFVGWWLMTSLGLNSIVALLAAFVLTFILGVATQLVSVQPLIGRAGTDFGMLTFITTFAVAMIVSNLALQYIGPEQREVPTMVNGQLHLYGPISVPWQSVTMAATSVGLMVVVLVALTRSRFGIAIRAIAEDMEAARLMGIPVKATFPMVMGLASALAGVAGVFLAAEFFASPTLGDKPLLVALTVVILGGLGSLPGSIIAAYMIGLIEAAATLYVSSTWALPIMYTVVILVLIVRPYGLMGEDTEVRL